MERRSSHPLGPVAKGMEITIDGYPVQAAPGSTILEAAKQVGIDIPHLCYHPNLSVSGACRLCVVKVEGARGLVAACAMPVANGQVVTTHDEELENARRTLVELLLAEREHNCLFCAANGACTLQDLAYRYQIQWAGSDPHAAFPAEETRWPIDESSEVLRLDHNRCVLCGRCVRACAEIAVQGVYEFAHRGIESRISPWLEQPLAETDCVSCGACAQACPTGAITEKHARFAGRPWELRKVRTVCPYCGVGCQIDLYVKDGREEEGRGGKGREENGHGSRITDHASRIVKVEGAPDGPDNRGHLCVKGRFGFDFVHHPDRLTTPLIRVEGERGEGSGGKRREAEGGRRNSPSVPFPPLPSPSSPSFPFREATWEEALSLVAARFQELRETHGPDSLAGLASAKCTNEENYLFQKFIRAVFGTNNVDHCARL